MVKKNIKRKILDKIMVVKKHVIDFVRPEFCVKLLLKVLLFGTGTRYT